MRFGDAALSLRTSGIGYGESLRKPALSAPTAIANEVIYRDRGVSEWYRNGPLVLEQGFTLAHRLPRSSGWLTIAVRVSGGQVLHRIAGGALFVRRTGRSRIRYGGLSATDVTGRSLPAWLDIAGPTLLLRVDDARAHYPLTIDPFVQQGSKLTPSNVTGQTFFGASVAVSADGNTALINGNPNDSVGRAERHPRIV